ncbi:hypothetical protein G6F50_018170 [Rhizopus delemar]|uniref:Uncharacterized protein n=1 Tax=Rhizopus delemar TaxID=936053 RepID=A0A9P7BZK6_9FUNG|nr:hypothetical protein G6F50_018170 [Rhizopus delemar]
MTETKAFYGHDAALRAPRLRGRSAGVAPAALDRGRIWLAGVDAVSVDGLLPPRARDAALIGQCLQGRQHDEVAIHLEERAQ